MMFSCSNVLPKKEYTAWVEDVENGLSAIKTVDDAVYKIQYKPIDYILSKKNKDSLTNTDYEDLHYIDLYLSNKLNPEYLKNKLNSKEEYYYRLQYFSSEVENDISLKQGDKPLKCLFTHYERSYGIEPHIKIVLAFEKNATNKEDLVFSYHDQMFNNGVVNMVIKESSLKNIPQVKNS